MKSIAVETAQLPAHIARHVNARHVNVYVVDEANPVVHIGSQQWSEGSRDLYSVASLDRDDVKPVTDPRPWPNNMGELGAVPLPARFVIIRTGTFCGKPATPAIYAHAADVAPALPAPAPEMTLEQKAVLSAIACYNSKGREQFRNDVRMTKARWDSIVAELAALDLATPRGGITVAGRNAASRDVYGLTAQLRKA